MHLTRKQLEAVIGDGKLDAKGENLYVKCPYCGHNEAGISLKRGHIFNCFRKRKCGKVSDIEKIAILLRKPLEGLKEKALLTGRLPGRLGELKAVQIEEAPEVKLPLGFRRMKSDSYLEDERGFTKEDFENYEIGKTNLVAKFKEYIIVVIRQKGKVVGYVARKGLSKEDIEKLNEERKDKGLSEVKRYLNCQGADFTKVLHGSDEITTQTTAILVEGWFDKRALDIKMGLPNATTIVCCTFGVKISPQQIKILKDNGIENVVLFYDPDVIPQIKKYGGRLFSRFRSTMIAFAESGNDPDEMSPEEILSVLGNAKDFLKFTTSKLGVNKLE